ncbi:hypothetical protein BX616_000327 [Lobosporangium transversale]|uniref:Uncharacterized protein n=1 Tax=Lobosporangium transversale TaxID=64571 RepID=A0A1Y2GA59_9FUNG|nr:hypothetical protein BCR41DRAFT_425924 [Lobosporangium transversale]KAF9907784.1 hypothetical protein BX616_000327 [Lobosporangium transversale]ORZ04419.1 hypothetical protein BCR41DRAFT_425924 [Lobosporangium transversale]|eukprot:XP_021876527.1 hypothetical protein BCR41DRAFT_425924 [Lobosporangium transversale]
MDQPQSPFWAQPTIGLGNDYDFDVFPMDIGGPRKKAANSTGLVTQLVISIALGLFALLTFCTLRTRWVAMFAPRSTLRGRHAPPILPPTFFGWIPKLISTTENEVLKCVGLDAVMLLRFYHMSMKLFFCLMIPGLLVILPVNYFSTRDGHDPTDPDDGFDEWSLLQKVQGTSLLYLMTQFTFTWVFSLITLYMIWQTFEGYIIIRRDYILDRVRSITHRTVMVIGLPPKLQKDRALATFYESLGAGEVESAYVCRYVELLKRKIEQRAHALMELEGAYTSYYGNPSDFPGYDPNKIMAENDRYMTEDHATGTATVIEDQHGNDANQPKGKKRPTEHLGFLGLFGKKVDKIDKRRETFAALDKAVQKLRKFRDFPTTSVGFVTFEEIHSAQIVAQTVNTKETLTCRTILAPEPRDVYWDNLKIPHTELGIRSVVVNTTVFFLIFFWSGPISIFSSFLNLETLEKLIPGVTKVAEASPVLKSVIQGFLPTLGVTIFLELVPNILEVLCIRQGIQSHSGMARSLYNKYYTFILFNVVLVFTIVGTWAQAFNKVYHNLGEFTLLLAASLPRVSPFFVNFIILKGIGQFPLRLLQIGDVFRQTFRGIFSKTPRDYAEARAPPSLKHGEVYANSTLAFVIVLIYSCIKPIILIFGAVFFAFGYLALKYQLLYVLFHAYESGGRTWPMVYNRIMVGLLIFQSTMLGLLMLKHSYVLGSLLAPLPIGTIWFWSWTSRKYRETAEFIPLEMLHSRVAKIQGSAHEASSAATGSSAQGPGHISINMDQHNQNDQNNKTPVKPSTNGSGNEVSVASASVTINPEGTQQQPTEEDDYPVVPNRYTDYRQPPMTLYPGVLNSGMRFYSDPAVSGPLPTLWLPLKKETLSKKTLMDEESRIGAHYSDSDSDDEHHMHEHLEAALARPPFMLPTQGSDMPQSYDEGDNLVGGGQDEDLSKLPPDLKSKATIATAGTTASTSTGSAAGRAPQSTPEGSQAESHVEELAETVSQGSAVEGIIDVYYHHPERRASKKDPNNRVRTVQGQGSHHSLLNQQKDTSSSTSAGGGAAASSSAATASK